MTESRQRLVICTPVAPLMADPRVASPQISQLLAGRTVHVNDEREDWYLVVGADGYEGWMHRGYVTKVPGDSARRSTQVQRLSLGAITTTASGMRRAMPLGAWLSAEERLKTGEIITATQQSDRFPPEAQAITRSAQMYFEGTSYLWGGVTPWGADCSGLVQSVFWLHGIQLKRDAWQQSQQGAPGEAHPADAHAADLLFFSDRDDHHVTHVAIALGGACIVHLALGRGGFAIERLDDTRDPYVQKLLARFIGARRILAPAAVP